MKLKAYSYIRMSTEAQLQGDSLRRQTEASRRYAEAHELELVTDVDLHDIGVSAYSGDNVSQGKFGRFLKAVRAGQIEKGSYLLVESFDRISRQTPLTALDSFKAIVEAGLVLVTLDDGQVYRDNIRTDQLLLSILKMVRANEESSLKGERVAKAWANKRANADSKKLTARCPSWLRLTADRSKFEIIEERAQIVRRIFNEVNSGLGVYTIVRRLNAEKVPTFTRWAKGWAHSTVNKVVNSPAVIGNFQPNRLVNGKRVPEGEIKVGYYPRIISDATYEAAQRIRFSRLTRPSDGQKGSGGRKGKHYANLFSKLAVCSHCGHAMTYLNKGKPPKGQAYLTCSDALHNRGCQINGRWRYDHFEDAFLKFVERLDLASIVSSEEHQSKRADLVRQLDALEGRQKILENEIKTLLETSLKMSGGSDILARELTKREPALAEAKVNQAGIRQQIAQLDEAALAYYSNPDQMSDLIARVRATRGENVFKVRALIASRLQALISNVALDLEYNKSERAFEVDFRDGANLMAFVSQDDPTKITRVVRSYAGEFTVKDADGNLIDANPMDDEE
jgi:DNA invertase Pin-like site-specific DNA recombinase